VDLSALEPAIVEPAREHSATRGAEIAGDDWGRRALLLPC